MPAVAASPAAALAPMGLVSTADGRRRSSRAEAREKLALDARRAAMPAGLAHHGVDASPYVRAAMAAGGSLDEAQRDELGQLMQRNMLTGPRLEDVLPPSFLQPVQDAFRSRGVRQLDVRSPAPARERYDGHMLTTSFVNPPGDSGEKEIPEPRSPKPAELSGPNQAHRAHSSPFALAGAAGNATRTVWAPQWANIGVDSRLEKAALKEHVGGAMVVHYRFDTDTHSTVGFAAHRSSGEFASMGAQYDRRGVLGPPPAPGSSRPGGSV